MFDRPKLIALFQMLPGNVNEPGKLTGARILGRPADYVARGPEGEPLLLLAFSGPDQLRPPIRLKHLKVNFSSSSCRVQEIGEGTKEGIFIVISCGAEDPALFGLFLNAAEALLAELSQMPTLEEVQGRVSLFVELFRKLSSPSTRSIKGLWAELLVIASSRDPAAWVKAWHSQATDKFDFSFAATRVDVKASEMPRRVHEFALEQLEPPSGNAGYIVSVLLRRDVSGTGVLGLAERVAEAIAYNASLIEKLWRNIAEAMGSDFSDAMDLLFDVAHAEQSLSVIDSSRVPKPTVGDARVFDVRFKVDITEEAMASRRQLRDVLAPG